MNELVKSVLSVPWGLSRIGLGWWLDGWGPTSAREASAPPFPERGADGSGPTGEPALPWLELGNRLDAFRTFRGAGGRSRGAAGDPGALRSDLAWVLGRSGGERLWAAEGIGYHHAEAAHRRRRGAELLPAAEPLPRELVLPVHSGVGLALAVRVLGEDGSRREDELLLERFVTCASGHALPGWEGAILEALGMAARLLYPGRVASLGRSLARLGDAPSRFYWHGVGRALYFAPTQAVPWGSAAPRAAGKALQEAPGEAERAQALSGVAWAVTLVNLTHPRVVEGLLVSEQVTAAPRDAIEHGVAAALLVWARGVGPRGVLQDFLDHRPLRPRAADAWGRRVRGPATALLEGLGRDLGSGAWGELFRQRPLVEVPRVLGGLWAEGGA